MALLWFVTAVLITASTGLPAGMLEPVGGDDWTVVSYDFADEDPAVSEDHDRSNGVAEVKEIELP